MSDERDQDTEHDRAAERERQLQRLFAYARPRLQPPADDAADIRRAVLAEWEAVTGRRMFRRRAGLAAAASVLLAAVLYVGTGRDLQIAAPLVASVERVEGGVETGTASRLTVGSGIARGTEIVTREGQVALRLASGGSLRVAAGSRVVLVGDDEAELVAGTLYFDSERRDAEFTVTTELGRIRDVGTQFFVQLGENERQLDVGVRDGRVLVARDGASESVAVGERLVATAGAGATRREPLATFGGDWAWAERLAPPFETDGRSVRDFLEWFAAQTGRTVMFADPEAERLAGELLSGSIDLEPLQKLAAVDALTDLELALEGERVVVRAP
jgi:hypothetical protein